ncbi:MAG: polymerase sigma factor SigM [Planctomycetaceae bacterium]|nr:polymerase sigma factor SigM [Planctomycetaceae bacterium]
MAEYSADDQLVAAIVEDRNDAIREFEQLFGPRIQAFARKRRIPSNDRDDVVQDVLADALRQIQRGRFRGEAALSTWVHQIMNGKVADYWRKQGKATVLQLQDLAENHDSLVTTNNPDVVAAVQQALGRLSTDDQLLLRLHEQEQYTLAEMCPILRVRKSAVAERLARARKRFRQAFAGAEAIIVRSD